MLRMPLVKHSVLAMVAVLAITLTQWTQATSAYAATTVYTTAAGGYDSGPAGSTPVVRDLGARITVPAGETRYISSKLVVGSADVTTEVSHLVYCAAPGSSTLAERLVSGENVLASASRTILTRGFVTAPATNALVCSLKAIFINHQSTQQSGSIQVFPTSYIQDVYGDIGTVAQTWQASAVLVNSSYSAAPVTFVAPAGATKVQAIGDVNITTCYGENPKSPCNGAGARLGANGAYVGTQLVVQQLNADGSACSTTTNGPLAGVFVSNHVHHYKINTWITDVAVSNACTSDVFKAWTRVTANAAYNSLAVEGNHQTVTAVFAP